MIKMTLKTSSINNKRSDLDICCHGYGCSNKPTEKIEVNAGLFGSLSLSLCSVCITKFKPREI